MLQPTVLVYAPGDDTLAAALQPLCAIRKLRLRRVYDADLNSTVGELALGQAAPASAAEPPLAEPVLVFCGLSKAQLDWMLVELRKRKIFCIKAVLTPDNAKWPFRALYQELTRERDRLGG